MTYLLNLIKYVILMLVQNIRCLMTITDLVLTADLEQQEAHRTEDSPFSRLGVERRVPTAGNVPHQCWATEAGNEAERCEGADHDYVCG